MRILSRLRLRSLAAALLFAPSAQAQAPLPPQGLPPAVSPRPAVEPSKPVPYTPVSPPRLLPPELIKPAAPAAPAVELKLTKFDPYAVEVRRDGRNWTLCAGKIRLKEFGENRNAAYEARQLVAELRLNQRGAIGTPQAVMEYWLADGKPPPLPALNRNVIPFDLNQLRVIEEQGAFFVGDDRRRLFNFGPYAEDAQQALQIIRHFEFNELGLVGSPEPSMTYLLKNENPSHLHLKSLGQQKQTDLAPQLAPRHPLDLPGIGRVGEFRPFDPMRIEVQKGGDGWHLIAGPHDFGAAGNTEYQARTAMQIAQRYPLTEYVRLGKSDFGFYLSNGMAPRGTPLGIRRAPFLPQGLAVKQNGNAWTVGDGRQTLGTFANADEAQTALKVIRYYGFNCACEAGTGLKYLAQDH
jgi:hypothetical protein